MATLNFTVSLTFADIEKAKEKLGYKPQTIFREGLVQFKDWFLENRHTI